MDYFLFFDQDEIYFNDKKVNLEEIEPQLIKKQFGIVIADWHVYNLTFNVNVKKYNDAKKAAENHFLYLNHNSNYNPTYFYIDLIKIEQGFKANVYYLSEKAEEFIDKFFELKVMEKCKFISPIFEFIKFNCYHISDFITCRKDDKIFTFNKKDLENFKEILKFEGEIKEVNKEELLNLTIPKISEIKVNFVKKNKSFEIIEKIFIPFLIFIFILNAVIFSFSKYYELKFKKNFELIKNENKILKSKVKPVLKAEKTLEKLKKVNSAIQKYTKNQFPYLDFFRILSKKVKILYIRSFRVYGNIVRFSGKTDSAIKLIEVLKKIPYIENPKIVSNITRDSRGFESFRIEARIKNE